MSVDFKPYLHSAHIEGYKSIVSCDVTFKHGLNIIIGKNGTGKTNLLEALFSAVTFDQYLGDKVRGEILVRDESLDKDLFAISILGGMNSSKEKGNMMSLDLLADKIVEHGDGFSGKNWGIYAKDTLAKRFPNLFPLFWKHNLPAEILLFDELLSLSIEGSVSMPDERNLESQPFFVQMLMGALRALRFEVGVSEAEIRSKLLEVFAVVSKFDLEFASYSPIKAIRLNPNFVVSNGMVDGTWDVFNLQLEFQQGERWFRYQQLSDGTKRLVLLISEAYCARGFAPNSKFQSIARYGDQARILLIEEPEIGVHPHQLHLIVNFLKETAREEQVILTTHSPQVLDILDSSELDRIIIADFDSKQGTTFRHLNKKEISKARRYMKELQLSDYWRFSDLEMR